MSNAAHKYEIPDTLDGRLDLILALQLEVTRLGAELSSQRLYQQHIKDINSMSLGECIEATITAIYARNFRETQENALISAAKMIRETVELQDINYD